MVMQQMRDGAQGIAAKIVMALLVFVLAAFGFGSFNLFQVSEPAVATVNGEEITQRELDGEVARQRNSIARSLVRRRPMRCSTRSSHRPACSRR